MRKLLLASYQFRTGEATYNNYELVAIESKLKNTDQQDVEQAAFIFEEWFAKVYPESSLDSVVIRPAISAGSSYPSSAPEVEGTLETVFRNAGVYYLREAGINTLAEAAALSDEQLLKFRNIGKMAVQRLRNYISNHPKSER